MKVEKNAEDEGLMNTMMEMNVLMEDVLAMEVLMETL